MKGIMVIKIINGKIINNSFKEILLLQVNEIVLRMEVEVRVIEIHHQIGKVVIININKKII